MRKKKIEVTDEQTRQRGEECGTFSGEYWRSMTPAQQEELVEIRERKVSAAAYRVLENEEAAGIRDKMEEFRNLSSPIDETIRDLYFAIHDEATRIKAINDLFYYESVRRNHDNAMVLEAYYRYEDVQRKLIFGWLKWPEFKRLIFGVATFNVLVFLARLIWPDIKERTDWIFSISVMLVFAYGLYWDIHLRRLESHYFLLWEIEKLRRGVHDRDLRPPLRRYELFSEKERQSGKRSVPREIPW